MPAAVLAGAAIAVIGLPLLTVVLDTGRDVIELPSVLLVYLVAVIAIATIGGAVLGLGSALAAFGLSNYYFTEPTGYAARSTTPITSWRSSCSSRAPASSARCVGVASRRVG